MLRMRRQTLALTQKLTGRENAVPTVIKLHKTVPNARCFRVQGRRDPGDSITMTMKATETRASLRMGD